MAETIVVIAIVTVVLALAGRSIYRTVAGRNKAQCCGCDSCACGDVNKSVLKRMAISRAPEKARPAGTGSPLRP